MKNSIARSCLTLATLATFSLPALAKTIDCEPELVVRSRPELGPTVSRALDQFEAGIRKLPETTLSDSFTDRLTTWYQSRAYRAAVKDLKRLNLKGRDQAALCDEVVQIARSQNLVRRQAKSLGPLLSQICGPGLQQAEYKLAESALTTPPQAYPKRVFNQALDRTPEGEQARLYIQSLIRSGALSTPDWMNLIAANPSKRIIPLADALESHWDKIGLDLNQVREVAGSILAQGTSLTSLAHWMTIPDGQLDALTTRMNPVQWLELMHARGHLAQDLTAQLKARIAQTVVATAPYEGQGLDVVSDLILDEKIEIGRVDAILVMLEKAWPKIYGPGVKLQIVPPDREGLTADQLTRVQTYLAGRPSSQLKKIQAEARAQTKLVEKEILSTQFDKFSDMRDAFDLASLFPNAEQNQNPDEQVRLREISKIYRRTLKKKIAEMRARNIEPSAEDLKWLAQATIALPPKLRPKMKKD